MGKKVKKKARSGQKEKHFSTASPRTVLEQSNTNTDTPDEKVSVTKEKQICAHLNKGVDLVKVSSKMGSSESIRCEDCREGAADRRASKGRGKHGKKKGGGSVDSKSESRAIWVCLGCGHFSCGGVGFPTTPQCHAVRHARQSRHPLAVQFENTHLIWCFPCNYLVTLEKSEANGEQKDILHDIMKIIKGRPAEKTSADAEDVWFGSGSVTSEMKSVEIIPSNLNGQGGYVVRGLLNLGNTCFFNSIMQNLFAMGRMRDYFLKQDGSVGPVTTALKKLFTETTMETGLRNVINPKPFFGCLCTKAPQFRGYDQHDSHELLRCLLDVLCAEELSAGKQASTPKEDAAPTFVDAIFGGELSSTVSCLECGHSSVVKEPFLDLSLPVPTKKPPSSKKVGPVSRTKKQKMPPKRSSRVSSKYSKDANPLPSRSASEPSANGKKSSNKKPPDATVVEKSMTDDKGSDLENNTVTQGSGNNNENITEDNSTWLDYLEPDTTSNDHDMTLQSSDFTIPLVDAGQSDAFSENTLESNKEICSNEEPTPSTGNFTWLDYCEPNIQSELDELVYQDSGNNDAVQSDDFLKHGPDSGQVYSVESNLGDNHSCNSWEDEAPQQVANSEILLLPFKEDASTTGHISMPEGDVSQQDSVEFDGLGDLFNEPEAVEDPRLNPASGVNASDSNEVATNGFMVGNISESDPDEVDNTNAQVSVESCLAYFTKPELLSKNEHAWQCESCSKALQEERLRSRKKRQKPKSNTSVNGREDTNSNNLQVLEKDCSFSSNVRKLNNGNISDQSGVLHNSSEIYSDQKARPDPLVSPLEDVKDIVDVGLSKLSIAPTGDRTCSEESLNREASGSCSMNEPRCSSAEVQQREMELLASKSESEESETEVKELEGVKVRRDATKRILFDKAPPILTIHLKRFGQDNRGRLNKLNGHVDFRDTIDLKPYMDPRRTEKEKYKYRLIGVVEHMGNMRSGHYIAYVRGGANKGGEDFVWYYISDAHVSLASREQVLRSEAYLLFYEEEEEENI